MFTTNASESINAVLKRKVCFKESQLPDFIRLAKELVNEQREEVVRALSGRGRYRLLAQYQHLAVSVQEWTTMRPDQRQRLMKSFEQAALSAASTEGVSQVAGQTTVSSGNVLCVTAAECGITTIPLITLEGIWNKANSLLSAENAITVAPGNDQKARMVLSSSSPMPHLVRSGTGGKYICDANCLHGCLLKYAPIA